MEKELEKPHTDITRESIEWLRDQWLNHGKKYLVIDGCHRYLAIMSLRAQFPEDIRYQMIPYDLCGPYATHLDRKVDQARYNKHIGEEYEETNPSDLAELIRDMALDGRFGQTKFLHDAKTVSKLLQKAHDWLQKEYKGSKFSERKHRDPIVSDAFDLSGACKPALREKRYTSAELKQLLSDHFNGAKSGQQISSPKGNIVYYTVTHNDDHKKVWDWIPKMAKQLQYGHVAALPFKVNLVYSANGNVDIKDERKKFLNVVKGVNEFSKNNWGGPVISKVYFAPQILTGKRKESLTKLVSVPKSKI